MVNIFDNITYFFVESCDSEIKFILNLYGGKEHPIICHSTTIAIASANVSDDTLTELRCLYNVPVVTSNWVIQSLAAGRLLPLFAFHPQIRPIFERLVICFTGLGYKDCLLLAAHVQIRGGQISSNYYTEATHVVVGKPIGEVYRVSSCCPYLHIVGVDWLIASITSNQLQPVDRYQARDLYVADSLHDSVKTKTRSIQCSLTQISPLREGCEMKNMTPSGSNNALKRRSMATNAFSNKLFRGEDQRKIDEILMSNIQKPIGTSLDISLQLYHGKTLSEIRPKEKSVEYRMFESQTIKTEASMTDKSNTFLTTPINSCKQIVPKEEKDAMFSPDTLFKPNSMSEVSMSGQFVTTLIKDPPPKELFPNASSTNTSLESPATSAAFLGCVAVLVFDYHDQLPKSCHSVSQDVMLSCEVRVGPERREKWANHIRLQAGEVIPVESIRDCSREDEIWKRVTHVIYIHSILQDVVLFEKAISCNKRVVSIYWVDYVLDKEKLQVPCRLIHVPCAFSPRIKHSLLAKQVVGITSFKGAIRNEIIHMIEKMGAQITDNLSAKNTYLLCERLSGEKVEFARENQIPCVNIRWLQDLYVGCLDPLMQPIAEIYTTFHEKDKMSSKTDILHLNIHSEKVERLLEAWKEPIIIDSSAWKVYSTCLSSVEEIIAASNKEGCKSGQAPPSFHGPTDEKEMKLNKETATLEEKESPFPPLSDVETCQALQCSLCEVNKSDVAIAWCNCCPSWITDQQNSYLQSVVCKLGGRLAPMDDESCEFCTHLVMIPGDPNVCGKWCRPLRLFYAVLRGIPIVTPKWIAASKLRGAWIDEWNWIAGDPAITRRYGVDLRDSLQRARQVYSQKENRGKREISQLFQGLSIFVSPRTIHSELCKNLIVAGCGKLLEKPYRSKDIADNSIPPRQVNICHESEAATLVVRGSDPRLYHFEEFILCAVLRQCVDYDTYQISYLLPHLFRDNLFGYKAAIMKNEDAAPSSDKALTHVA